MVKRLIAIDDGHGMDTAGKRTPTLPNGQKSETGNFMHENEFNRAVADYLKVELERNGFDTLMVAPTDADTALGTRTNLANAKDADLYISIHANANAGKWFDGGGIETFVYPSGESKRIGTILHKHIMKGTSFKDRGVKDGSHLWVIRKVKMASVLLELGFMDSNQDYKHLLSDDYRKECAREIAQGVCEAYKVTYKEKVVATPAVVKEPVKTVSASTHTVVKGDTFYSISKKYDLTVAKLEEYNPKVKPSEMKIGEKLNLKPATVKKVVAKKAVVKTKKLVYKKLMSEALKSKGDDVKALQEALNSIGYSVGTADGIFGKKTTVAVKKLQTKYFAKKEVDGIVGKDTIAKINSLIK